MSPAAPRSEVPQIQPEGNRLVIPVPSRQAEGLQNHLRRQGIGSTLCLIPYTEEARLELWAGADAASVQAALDVSGN